MFPIEKYKFYRAGQRIIATSTYAGKTVRGVAICDDEDEFDVEKGKQLAAARCALKIAQKRNTRACQKYGEALDQRVKAIRHCNDMKQYFMDSESAFIQAEVDLKNLLKTM